MIYFDNAATTPLDDGVLSKMTAVLRRNFGNSQSQHSAGRAAGEALLSARDDIAEIFGCRGEEVYFTSGGAEAGNFAVKGVCAAKKKGHIIVSLLEHPSVLESALFMRERGFDVTFLKPDEGGFINPDDLLSAIRDNTFFCAVMAANNELGTIQPVQKIGEICTRFGIFYYCDFVQAVGSMPFPTKFCSAFSVSAHKFHGPKGVGAMYIKNGSAITPLIHGGMQERGLRGGTVNVAGAVGLAEALKNAVAFDYSKIAAVRDRFLNGVLSQIKGSVLNGGYPRVAGNANISFPGCDGQSVVFNLDLSGVCASTGSACSAGAVTPSKTVAAALGDERARTAVRFTFSKYNTAAEADEAVAILQKVISKLRPAANPA